MSRFSPEYSDGSYGGYWRGRPPEGQGPVCQTLERIVHTLSEYQELFEDLGCRLMYTRRWSRQIGTPNEVYNLEVSFEFNPYEGWDQLDPHIANLTELEDEAHSVCKLVLDALHTNDRFPELVTALEQPTCSFVKNGNAILVQVHLANRDIQPEPGQPDVYYPN